MADNTLVATFYSFKGGVGRTLTLVNTAVSLTRMGHSVIIWDLDIEAPGIQNISYFRPEKENKNSMYEKITGGFVDIASEFEKTGFKKLPAGIVDQYLFTHPENDKLRLLASGDLKNGAEYSRKFNAISWARLFGRTASGKAQDAGYFLFHSIRKELLAYHSDFILIDSRTGYTDVGGVCSVFLPDLVFLAFTYGNQNLDGTRAIHHALTDTDRIKSLRQGRPLKTYLIASMVPTDRTDLLEKRKNQWKEFDLSPHVEIPYNSEIAFEETIWAAKYPDHEFSQRYARIADKLKEERQFLSPDRPMSKEKPDHDLLKSDLYPDKAKEFETKTAELFRLMGFEAELDKDIAGSQIDIFLTRKDQIDTFNYIVECKDWRDNINKSIVDEVENNLKAARKTYPRCNAIIVARNGFTKDAKTYANELSGITLKTYDELLNGIVDFNRYLSWIKTLYSGTDLERNYIEQNVIVEEDRKLAPALDYFHSWLKLDGGGHFTLLGDFGTGKTSFTKRFAHDLAVAYEKDKTANRIPVLINLKDVQKALGLENILFDHFSKTAGINVSPQTILHLLREGKLVIIFDGFDEMATQTNAGLTLQNFQELNRAFSGKARVILTCRTHYFRDRAETEETLKQKKKDLSEASTDLYRSIKDKAGYFIAYLQEFTDEQVGSYLKKTCPNDWENAQKTIDRIYNLKDLSSRPVLLEMIVKSLDKITKDSGKMQVSDLYSTYVKIWEEHDDWRQELTRQGKELLVEEIALQLWEKEADKYHHSFLYDVLCNHLKNKSCDLSKNTLELAQSEVRTASFLVRDDQGNYGFAHRSFMEFFLARRISRKLSNEDTTCLRMRRLSKEVVLFLSQMAGPEKLQKICKKILENPYQNQVSENALVIFYWATRYGLSADGEVRDFKTLCQKFKGICPKSVQLEEAKLDRMDLSGMDLSHANLKKAGLQSTILFETNLQGACLDQADLSFANLENVDLNDTSLKRGIAHHALCRNASFARANLIQADFYGSNLTGADLTSANCRQTDFSAAGLLKAIFDETVLKQAFQFGMGGRDTAKEQLQAILQKGHSSSVWSVVFSPDGKLLASGSGDNTVKLWDVGSGRQVRECKGHSSSVNSVVFSPDGKLLASGSADHTVKLWDVGSGKEMRKCKGHSSGVNSVVFSPDGKLLASGSADKTVKLWDVESGRQVRECKGHSSSVNSVVFSPDGKLLASGSADITVKLWDVGSGRQVRECKGHSSSVNSVVFSPDGKLLASGSADKTVKLWDVESGRQVWECKGHSSGVNSVVFSPDGKLLASGSADKTVKLWDVGSGRQVWECKGHSSGVNSVVFSPGGKLLASGSADNTVKLWDVESGRQVWECKGHSLGVNSVVFSPDGKLLASGSDDKTVKLWDVGSGKEVRECKGHSYSVWSVVFSPGGKLLASGSADNTVKLWDVGSGQQVRECKDHSLVLSVVFSPDGKLIAGGSADSTVKLWDVGSGRQVRECKGHSSGVMSVVFSPDGKLLASGSLDNTVKLWDVGSGRQARECKGHSTIVRSVVFSPDGKLLASGSLDKTVKLWDLEIGRQVREYKGHSSGVISVVFSPDGKLLASGSADHTVKLWDVVSGKEIRSFASLGQSIQSIAFSSNQKGLAVGFRNGSCQTFHLIQKSGKIEKLEPGLTFWHLPDSQWAAFDSQNRFVCSPGGRKYITFSDNLALYTPDDIPELECPEGLGALVEKPA